MQLSDPFVLMLVVLLIEYLVVKPTAERMQDTIADILTTLIQFVLFGFILLFIAGAIDSIAIFITGSPLVNVAVPIIQAVTDRLIDDPQLSFVALFYTVAGTHIIADRFNSFVLEHRIVPYVYPALVALWFMSAAIRDLGLSTTALVVLVAYWLWTTVMVARLRITEVVYPLNLIPSATIMTLFQYFGWPLLVGLSAAYVMLIKVLNRVIQPSQRRNTPYRYPTQENDSFKTAAIIQLLVWPMIAITIGRSELSAIGSWSLAAILGLVQLAVSRSIINRIET